MGGVGQRRKNFKKSVMDWATAKGPPRPDQNSPLMSFYGGPAELSGHNGWNTTARLDPILHRYDRISPHVPGFSRPTRDKEGWILYDTSKEITSRIGEVYISQYKHDFGPDLRSSGVELAQLNGPRNAPAQPGDHRLFCFEGGTGAAKKDHGSNWSLMGYVLQRRKSAAVSAPYDIVIAFRGSRSGTTRLAAARVSEVGNPDWVTDLKLSLKEISEISPDKFYKGFALATQRCLPTVLACLEKIHVLENGNPPRAIHVTGHSLGGALAAGFCSAIALGSEYGPNGCNLQAKKGPILSSSLVPTGLEVWPWSDMDMTTFAAPGVGNREFKQHFDSFVSGRNIRLGKDPVATNPGSFCAGSDLKFLNKKGPLASHEPTLIRQKLRDRLSKIFSSPNYTQATVSDGLPYKAEWDREPWRVCASVWDALDDLLALQKKVPSYGSISDMLPADLAASLVIYLECYHNRMQKPNFAAEIVENGRNQAATDFDTFKNALSQAPPTDLNAASQLYQTVENTSVLENDKELGKFLRIWLYLIVLQSGQTDYDQSALSAATWIAPEK